MAGVEAELKLDAQSVRTARAAMLTLATKVDTRKVMEKAGREIIALSDPLTPMKTGELRHSAYVFVEKEAGLFGSGLFQSQDWTLIVGYGDPSSPASKYAQTQHETQYLNYTTPGTGPYFLKKGIDIWARDAGKRLAAGVSDEIAKVARSVRPMGVFFA